MKNIDRLKLIKSLKADNIELQDRQKKISKILKANKEIIEDLQSTIINNLLKEEEKKLNKK